MRRTIKRRWLFIVCGIALLALLGATTSRPTVNHRQPLQKIAAITRDYHSPYPWIEAVRKDGQRGYFVYAPADQIPCDWQLFDPVREHPVGMWQFVFTNGTPAPFRPPASFSSILVYQSAKPLVETEYILSLCEGANSPRQGILTLLGSDEQGGPEFQFTPAGEAALYPVP